MEKIPVYYQFALLSLIPVVRIFMRAGFKPYWAAMLFVPHVGMALCAAFLAVKWPKAVEKK